MAKENDVKVVGIGEKFSTTDASVEQIFTSATTGLVSKEEYKERRELLERIVEEEEAKRRREEDAKVPCGVVVSGCFVCSCLRPFVGMFV